MAFSKTVYFTGLTLIAADWQESLLCRIGTAMQELAIKAG
jgi:hypothetical protein